jgi:hypothetical protein
VDDRRPEDVLAPVQREAPLVAHLELREGMLDGTPHRRVPEDPTASVVVGRLHAGEERAGGRKPARGPLELILIAPLELPVDIAIIPEHGMP